MADPNVANNQASLNVTAGQTAGDRIFADGFEALVLNKVIHFVGSARVAEAQWRSQFGPETAQDFELGIEPVQDGFETSTLGFEDDARE